MVFKTTDALVQKSRGSVTAAVNYLKTPLAKRQFAIDYINELWRLCQLTGIDFGFAYAQFAHETARGSSAAFVNEGNPAGIGIFDDGSRQSIGYETGQESARGQVVHLYAYIFGEIPRTHELYNYRALDPRYSAALQKYGGQAKTIGFFGNGKWATDPDYAQGIVAHANAAFAASGETPMATPQVIDYSKLSFPMHVDFIPASQVNNRPGLAMVPRSVTWHETGNTGYNADASMHNTWLHNGAPGAADVNVSVHYFVDDKQGFQTAPLNENTWHAGDGPNGTGNRTSISIECCVNSNGNLAKAQANVRELIAALLKQLPSIDDNAAVSVVQHNYWSGKNCPTILRSQGTWVWQLEQINKINANNASPYVPASVIPGFDGTKDVTVNNATFHAEKRNVRTAKTTKVYQYATPSAGETRKPLKADQGVAVLGWVNGEIIDGDNRWWITPKFSRIPVSATIQKPGDQAPTIPNEENPDPNENPETREHGPKIVNGRPYYPIQTADGKNYRELTIIEDADLKKSVLSPKAVKVAKKGEHHKAVMFTTGPEVHNETIWWVLEPENPAANAINHGLRVAAAYTDQRPD